MSDAQFAIMEMFFVVKFQPFEIKRSLQINFTRLCSMRLLRKCCLVVILYGLLSSCSREPTPQLLTGDWLWVGSSGGIAGMTYKPKSSERIILNLSGDGKFTVRQNDTLVHNGTFQLTRAKSIYSGKEEIMLKTNEVKTSYHRILRYIVVVDGIVIILSNTELSIGDNRYDGFGSSFVRN